MDAQMMALAMTAGTAIVGSMATGGWQRTREGIVELWRNFRPDRAEQIDEELEATRTVLAAPPGACDGQRGDAHRALWQGNIVALLLSSPAAVPAVRRLVDELEGNAAIQAVTSLHAVANDHGRVYQAGRDQHIAER